MVGTSASISEGFQVAAKRVVLESQQAMAAAIKEERFEDALEYAEKVLAVDPDNVMGQKFAALLQEKIELDDLVVVGEGEEGEDEEDDQGEEEESEEDSEADEDSEDEVYDDVEEQGTEAPQASAANGNPLGVEGQKEDDDDDDDDGDDDDDDDEEEEEDVDGIISMPAKSLNMTSEQRRQMKEALAKQIYELKIEQEMGGKCSLLGI